MATIDKFLKAVKKLISDSGMDAFEQDPRTGELVLRTGFFQHSDDSIHEEREERDEDELSYDEDDLDRLEADEDDEEELYDEDE